MNDSSRLFPFGQQVFDVVQTDISQKVVFVLGVYSSAVHAKWLSKEGKTLVNALAVASEPDIFWRGDNPEEIISSIKIPKVLGKLVPAKPMFNGPSGIALDSLIINPLGLERNDAWLCDLITHSCTNPSQKKAIEREYLPIAERYGLPKPTVPLLPRILSNEIRRKEIVNEIIESGAKVLILLGDLPIRWFIRFFDNRWTKLSDFSSYGQLHNSHVGNKEIKILPLAHPRQIAKLGHSTLFWYETHSNWLRLSAKNIMYTIVK
jgi:hypothetical protein